LCSLWYWRDEFSASQFGQPSVPTKTLKICCPTLNFPNTKRLMPGLLRKAILEGPARLRYRFATRHAERAHEQGAKGIWHGQFGQDKYLVEKVFDQLRGGFFVDVGAHDGISFSNSLVLERDYGWNGIAIEANPKVFGSLERNRTCACVNAAVSDENGTATFLSVQGPGEMLSGLKEKHNPRHLERINGDGESSVSEITIATVTLGGVLKEANVQAIDLVCIDTEGSEASILNHFLATSPIRPRIVMAENNYFGLQIPKMMQSAGYELLAILGRDEIYRFVA
jgi:FkbM family methyltransferase